MIRQKKEKKKKQHAIFSLLSIFFVPSCYAHVLFNSIFPRTRLADASLASLLTREWETGVGDERKKEINKKERTKIRRTLGKNDAMSEFRSKYS